MKPLAIDQKILTWLCILPAKKNTDNWKKRSYVTLILVLIVTNVTVFLSSLLHVIKFGSVDVLEASFGVYQAIDTIPAANAIIVSFLFHHEIPPIFQKLSRLYTKCMSLISFLNSINRFFIHLKNS